MLLHFLSFRYEFSPCGMLLSEQKFYETKTKMNTKRLTYSLLVGQICAMSSQTKAEHWGQEYTLLDDDVCDGKDECDIIMTGGHLRAFASSCHNAAYDPLL
jgi:hypothetical protein